MKKGGSCMPKNNYSDDQIIGKCKNNCYCIKNTISPVPPPIAVPQVCEEQKCKGGRCSPSDESPGGSWAADGYCDK